MNDRAPDPHTLVGPYVLDALPGDERDLFEEHLDRCPECRAEAAELFAAAAHLGQAVAVVPPAALRQRVLAGVEVTRQVGPGAPLASRAARARWPLALAAAAVLVVVAALGALALQADSRADRAERLAAVVSAPDAQTVEISGDGGTMRLIASPGHDRSVIVAEGMAPPEAGKVYALWFQRDGHMVPAGLFAPDASGSVRQEVEGVPVDVVGVTVEPEGGSDEPTLPTIAAGTL